MNTRKNKTSKKNNKKLKLETKIQESKMNSTTSKVKQDNVNDSGFLNDSTSDSDQQKLMVDEQKQLSNLNDRLANYIDHVRQNQHESKILKSFEEIQKIPTIQLDNIKECYKTEIASLREALDQKSNECSKLIVQNGKISSEKSNLDEILADKCKEIELLRKKLTNEEAYSTCLKHDLEKTKKELTQINKQFNTCKEQLEKEVLSRTVAENAVITVREKMRFNNDVFKKELGALMTTNRQTLEKMKLFKNEFVDNFLIRDLRVAREELAQLLNDLMNKFHIDFQDQINKSSKQVLNQISQNNPINDKHLTKEYQAINTELTNVKTMYEKLKLKFDKLNIEHCNEMKRLNKIIDDMMKSNIDDLENLLKRISNLIVPLGEKIMFDTELNAYKRMLDNEEDRTNKSFSEPAVKKRKSDPSSNTNTNLSERRILHPQRSASCIFM